jgi:IS1 family transposase
LRVAPAIVYQVVNLLAEGVGIRAIQRLTGLNRRTVLRILEFAGERCASLLEAKVKDTKPALVEVDEIWGFVFCKQVNAAEFRNDHGDQYTYLASDRDTKLIISYLTGKRTMINTLDFIQNLKDRTSQRFQLSTDGFVCYKGYHGSLGAVRRVFKSEIDYGAEIKTYSNEVEGQRRYSPPVCTGVRRAAWIGNPDKRFICTAHAERANLSVRLFNRRFTRLTLGYSKKLANHRHSVAIFVAHFNFCRKHSTIGQTPAQAAGLTDHKWTPEELLTTQLPEEI